VPTVLFRIFKPVAPQKQIVANSMIRSFEDDDIMCKNNKELRDFTDGHLIFMNISQKL
jgi:hypothetical protein